ncbi:hypothetical protein HaLaN_00784, partial [Haematococcus lacustris]
VAHSFGGPELAWHPVTPAMTKLGYQAADCCQAVADAAADVAAQVVEVLAAVEAVWTSVVEAGAAGEGEVAGVSVYGEKRISTEVPKADGATDK